MIVSKDNIDLIVDKLSKDGTYSFDTETYGLFYYQRLFSIAIYDGTEGYYFNFNASPDHRGIYAPNEFILTNLDFKKIAKIFANSNSTFFAHNAKFDMHKLSHEGIEVFGKIYDTEVLCKILYNAHFNYKLDSCAKRIGLAKDDAVEAYISEHSLYENSDIPGKLKKNKNKFYNKVPFEIISKYALTDAEICYKVGMDALSKLKKLDADTQDSAKLGYMSVVENESKLTKVIYKMEKHGVLLDYAYTSEALKNSQQALDATIYEYKQMAGKDFINNKREIEQVLVSEGETVKHNERGNSVIDKKVLKTMTTPIAKILADIRKYTAEISNFYSSYLFYADPLTHVVHTNYRQCGAATGRFSSSDPNLQNIKKDEEATEEDIQPRRCFTARPGTFFAMLDYDQQEFRLMLDYAGETELIRKIMQENLDVHQATANEMNETRKNAKGLNFGLVYGMGKEKLGRLLKCSIEEASRKRSTYFRKFQKIDKFFGIVKTKGKKDLCIYNWAGRRLHIDQARYSYKLINHLCQSGGADVVKFAMTEIDAYLSSINCKSKMVLQIHDELIFEIAFGEEHIIPEIKRIMESIYKPKNGLYLTVGCDVSYRSLAVCDKKEFEYATTTGKE